MRGGLEIHQGLKLCDKKGSFKLLMAVIPQDYGGGSGILKHLAWMAMGSLQFILLQLPHGGYHYTLWLLCHGSVEGPHQCYNALLSANLYSGEASHISSNSLGHWD